jgi:hypothetical protein
MKPPNHLMNETGTLTRLTTSVAIPNSAAPPTPKTNRALVSKKSITTAMPSSPFLLPLRKSITTSDRGKPTEGE